MLTAHKHEMGIRLYHEGLFEEACKVLGEALGERVTSELANDWGAAELACGHADRAEQGFVHALKLDVANAEAAENLGVLLGGLGRVAEAICVLEQAVSRAGTGNQTRLSALLAEYRNRYPSQGRSEAEAVLHSALADVRSACATPKGPESVIAARLLSRIEKRPTDDCLVYKPDFTQVTYHAAELRGGSWSRREDHVVGENREEAIERGRAAARQVRKEFAWARITSLYEERIRELVGLWQLRQL
jgi:tetratricopeptide (TPR) repeat protein